MTALIAAWLGVNLGILAALVHAARRKPDDLTAVMDAPAEPTLAHLTEPPADYGYAIPEDLWGQATPIHDAAWLAAIENACRIEKACEEWAEEVDALADVELQELIEGGER